MKCKLDTVDLVKRIEHLDNKERRRELVRAGFQPDHGFTETRLIRLSCQTEWHSGIGCCLWEADHRLRVASGGGECDGDNIDTLCLRCHGRKSYEENKAARLAHKAQASNTIRCGKRKPKRAKTPKKVQDKRGFLAAASWTGEPTDRSILCSSSSDSDDDDAFDERSFNRKSKSPRRRKEKGYPQRTANKTDFGPNLVAQPAAETDLQAKCMLQGMCTNSMMANDWLAEREKAKVATLGVAQATSQLARDYSSSLVASRSRYQLLEDSDSESEDLLGDCILPFMKRQTAAAVVATDQLGGFRMVANGNTAGDNRGKNEKDGSLGAENGKEDDAMVV